MDALLVVAGLVVPLALALAWAVWYLLARCRKERQPPPTSHAFRGQGEAVTVAELLDDTLEQGEGIRLNWSADDEARVQQWPGLRPYAQDQVGTEVIRRPSSLEGDFPTEVLPRVEDTDEP